VTLHPGDRLGSYEVVSALGMGGMGEVYRARDTKLGREVAIKILSQLVTSDADRLARFEREARILAALNHSHIGAIYGLEDADGVRALVLELIEGETLADRIQRGPVPVAETLTIARQIADALETAHDKGIIHRDLKPANIKITPAGVVKVLDFGLAKAVVGDGLRPDLSHSPTILDDGTRQGIILGTAPYMSPDQARGKPVDKRADIWAFGCVLYEMLTGQRPFPGETLSDVVAAILGREPAWAALPAPAPDAIRRLLRRCLEKDEALRLRDIGDARLEIDEARRELLAPGPAVAPVRRTERFVWLAAVGVLSLAAMVLATWAFRPTPPPPEVRLEINTPSVSDPNDLASLAISPDGRTLVFAASGDGAAQLWTRQLDSVEIRPIPGTVDGAVPFWSPDGRSVAFYSDGTLKRIDLAGGLVRTLTAATVGIGGAWNREGVILFVQNPASPIMRISAEGGTTAAVTRFEAGHAGHSFPHFLPDGRHFLYYVNGAQDVRGVYLGELDESATRKLFDADSAAVYAAGHLVFVRGATLFAQGFNLSALEATGSQFPVATGVMGSMLAGTMVPLSATAAGAIAFRVGSAQMKHQFVWVDRTGKEVEAVGDFDEALVGSPSGSPDVGSVALMRRVNGNSDVWLLDARRGVLSRFTDNAREDIFPLWSRDGSRIVFTTNRNGVFDLYQKPTNGTGVEEVLLTGTSEEAFACDWSPDGQLLLFQRRNAKTGFDLWVLPLRGGGKPFVVGQTEFDERDGQISPDGKWIAFYSNRSGRYEVYVQPFPGSASAVQVSTSGGAQVRWRPDGRELFYIALDGRLTATPIQTVADGQPVIGRPVALFVSHVGSVLKTIGAQYVVSPDGQRFLMNSIVQAGSPTPIRLILNWQPRP
jgi:serine/threonine protein kinase/Tol biopolymer transport system component